jgi:hypothetical protein
MTHDANMTVQVISICHGLITTIYYTYLSKMTHDIRNDTRAYMTKIRITGLS